MYENYMSENSICLRIICLIMIWIWELYEIIGMRIACLRIPENMIYV